MAFSRDGKIFAGTHSRNVVRLHDAVAGRVLADLEAPYSKFVTSLSFNHVGTQVAPCESRDALPNGDLRLIREHLAGMRLDWELPPYPPEAAPCPGSLLVPAKTSARGSLGTLTGSS
jgi:hypothetical protein